MSNGNTAVAIETGNTHNDDSFRPHHPDIRAPIDKWSAAALKNNRTTSALQTVNMRGMAPLLDTLDHMEERLFVLIATAPDIVTATAFLDESIRTVKRMADAHACMVDKVEHGIVDANNTGEVIGHAIDLAMLEIITHPKIDWSIRRECFEDSERVDSSDIPAMMHVLTKLHAVCSRHHIIIPGEVKRNFFQRMIDAFKAQF